MEELKLAAGLMRDFGFPVVVAMYLLYNQLKVCRDLGNKVDTLIQQNAESCVTTNGMRSDMRSLLLVMASGRKPYSEKSYEVLNGQ